MPQNMLFPRRYVQFGRHTKTGWKGVEGKVPYDRCGEEV